MKKRELVPIFLVILSFIIGLYMYNIVPDMMPSHWNASGDADAYAPKAVALFVIPIILLILYLILTFITRIEIYKENVKKSEVPYFRFRLSFVVFIFSLYIVTIIQVFRPFPMNYFIIPAMSFLFLSVSHLLKNIKRNFFIGFRTPWTISSEKVWNATNKAASRFFFVYSFVILVGLLFQYIAIVLILLTLIVGILWLTYYSYRLYKLENNKY